MNGKKEEAMKYFNQQIDFCNESIRQNDPYGSGNATYDLAGVYAFLGNKKEAYKWLRQYEKLGFIDGLHEYIKADRLFDNLRDDDEFKEIVKRANDKAAEIRARINQLELQGGVAGKWFIEFCDQIYL
jgi:tetratricopeptide (TPR) repeat protein